MRVWGSQLELILEMNTDKPKTIDSNSAELPNSFLTAKLSVNQSQRLTQIYFKTWSGISVCEDVTCWDIFQTRPHLQLVYNPLPDSLIYCVHNTLTLWVSFVASILL